MAEDGRRIQPGRAEHRSSTIAERSHNEQEEIRCRRDHAVRTGCHRHGRSDVGTGCEERPRAQLGARDCRILGRHRDVLQSAARRRATAGSCDVHERRRHRRGASAAPALRGASHGAWERIEPDLFAVTRVFFRFNPLTGAYLGTQKVNATVRVAPDGETFPAVSLSELRPGRKPRPRRTARHCNRDTDPRRADPGSAVGRTAEDRRPRRPSVRCRVLRMLIGGKPHATCTRRDRWHRGRRRHSPPHSPTRPRRGRTARSSSARHSGIRRALAIVNAAPATGCFLVPRGSSTATRLVTRQLNDRVRALPGTRGNASSSRSVPQGGPAQATRPPSDDRAVRRGPQREGNRVPTRLGRRPERSDQIRRHLRDEAERPPRAGSRT